MLEKEFVKTLQDWLAWYNYHSKSAENAGLENQVKFLHKAVRGLFFINAAMADELQRVSDGDKVSQNLVLPVGVKIG